MSTGTTCCCSNPDCRKHGFCKNHKSMVEKANSTGFNKMHDNMKIRTIDGEMVTPRVGMLCYFTSVNGQIWEEMSPVTIYEISNRDGGCIRYTDYGGSYDDEYAAPCHFMYHEEAWRAEGGAL